MLTVLFVSHVKDESLSNGGSVFSSSVVKLINSAIPDIEISELYCLPSNPKVTKTFRKISSLLQSACSEFPAKVRYFYSREFSERIQHELTVNEYDLVVLDHAEMLWVVDLLPRNVPVIHISHNIEHCLYMQYVEKYNGWPVMGSMLKRDAVKYRQFERDKVREVGNLITISCEDREFWNALGAGMNVLALNPSFDYSPVVRQRSAFQGGKVLLGFLGNMEWWPNRDAVSWLSRYILPYLSIDYELHLFGLMSEHLGNGRNVIGHGFVDDIGMIWNAVDVMVNPIVTGAGVNVKVAEGIYNKMPMICTPLAIQGLSLAPDPSVVVMDTPEQWIDFINTQGSLDKLVFCGEFPNADSFSFLSQTQKLQQFLAEVMC